MLQYAYVLLRNYKPISVVMCVPWLPQATLPNRNGFIGLQECNCVSWYF